MKRPKHRWPTKSLAGMLVFAVAYMPLLQQRAEAMLAPAGTVQSAPQFDREQDVKTIQTALESKILREKLHTLGLSDAEIQTRLSNLSDREVHQLASQIRSVHPAGDVLVGVLVIVVLVLLVIFLIKRI
jgi:hypothetical protein